MPVEFTKHAIPVADSIGLLRLARRAAVFCVLFAALSLLAACAAAPAAPPADVPQLTQRQVADRFNGNLSRVDRLWARSVVEIQWSEGKKKKFEQGEGNLILQLPGNKKDVPTRVAFSVGKLGNIMMWAGCDATRYWLFDLRDARSVMIGRHANAKRLEPDDLPVPVQPLELVRLLGVTPIEPEPRRAASPALWDAGAYVVDVPGGVRVWVDPATFFARRIDLLDDKNATRISCLLSAYEPMELDQQPPGAWPKVATRLAITIAPRESQSEAKMTVFLSGLTDGIADEKIRDNAFDYDSLRRIFKVEDVIDVDNK